MREDIKKRIEQIENRLTPLGYKKTRIGIIPNEWSVSNVSSFLVESKKLSNDIQKYPLFSSSRKGLIKQSEYYSNRIAVETNLGYKIVPQGFVTYRHMSDDDIFFFNVNDTGDDILVSSEYPVFTTKDMDLTYFIEHINNMARFLYFCRAQKQGGTRTRLYFRILQGYTMPIPPKYEQKNIANILNHCDKIIELKRQLIVEERKRKKCLIQQLLDSECDTHGIHANCERTSASLGQLFEFGPSLSASRADLGNEGVCYLHYGDIHSNSRAFIDVQAQCATFPKLPTTNYSRFLLRHGDVVFVDASEDYGGASKYVVVVNPTDIPLVAGLHTIPARSKTPELDIDYKKYCFQSGQFKKQVTFYVSGMKIYGLNKENLAKIKVSYPPLAEQRAIAKLLMSADMNIDLLAQELSQWQQKKKALMQLLLTGLVRV